MQVSGGDSQIFRPYSYQTYKRQTSQFLYIVGAVDKNKTQFSIMPDRGQEREMKIPVRTKEGNKETIFKTRIY
jgi:hypothetical protein